MLVADLWKIGHSDKLCIWSEKCVASRFATGSTRKGKSRGEDSNFGVLFDVQPHTAVKIFPDDHVRRIGLLFHVGWLYSRVWKEFIFLNRVGHAFQVFPCLKIYIFKKLFSSPQARMNQLL